MSRHIQTVLPEMRKLNNISKEGKLILTNINNRTVSLLLQNDILISAQVIPENKNTSVGEIYIGKVKNILSNTNSCFVEIANEQICYLPLNEADHAFILNRECSSSKEHSCKKLVQGDELPVQIIRDALKTKPAAVTTALEIQSEYFIFKVGSIGLGVSNKIDKIKSKEIKSVLAPYLNQYTVTVSEVFPEYYVIARTKCQELNREELIKTYLKQQDEFLDFFRKARYRTCYSCLRKVDSFLINSIKQVPEHEYHEIITDIPEIYDELSHYHSVRNVRWYQDAFISLKNLYGLQTKLDNACMPKVWLKSGANLVIEQTECLTSIDVNSSKNIKGSISEDILFQINMEAAQEAALQIRLRNLSGIIIIDFINMKSKEKEEELLKYLKECALKDPVPTRVIDITPLGLAEITRKKINMSLKEQFK